MNPPRSTSEALGLIAAALDAVDHASRAALGHAERLELVEAGRRVAGRVAALVAVLVSEADAAGSAMVARGTPTTSWLALSGQASTKEAAALVFTARDVAAHPRVQSAALDGAIGVGQARAIHRVLTDLPATLTADQRAEAERFLLERAERTPADQVAGLTASVLAHVTPEADDTAETEAARLEAQTRRAHRRRSLTFRADGDGSVLIRGSLPNLAASGLIALVDAYAESDRRRARDAGDVRAERRTPEQRRADGLLALVAAHQRGRAAPTAAGDRPRVVVTMREADLRARAEQAGVLPDGAQISAGDLRRLCCDADLVPAVLGAGSEVLDIGRAERLVTPAIRRALTLRDGGCVFPGCDVGASACDAHHVVPWWAGGETALSNLALLCTHHHQLVEPPRFFAGAPPDRWELRMSSEGLPEIIPPVRVDPQRRPIARSGGPGHEARRAS